MSATMSKAKIIAIETIGPQPISELTPLDVMLAVMRDENAPVELRVEAAVKALPYYHTLRIEYVVADPDTAAPSIGDARATVH